MFDNLGEKNFLSSTHRLGSTLKKKVQTLRVTENSYLLFFFPEKGFIMHPIQQHFCTFEISVECKKFKKVCIKQDRIYNPAFIKPEIPLEKTQPRQVLEFMLRPSVKGIQGIENKRQKSLGIRPLKSFSSETMDKYMCLRVFI